jgi:pectate lyase
MKSAAAEVGATIYIGAQINNFDGTNGWNIVDRTWNAGVFSEVGDSADFYVEHNYFGGGTNLKTEVDLGRSAINDNITFMRGDIAKKGAYSVDPKRY